jgi:hypothetical protein
MMISQGAKTVDGQFARTTARRDRAVQLRQMAKLRGPPFGRPLRLIIERRKDQHLAHFRPG